MSTSTDAVKATNFAREGVPCSLSGACARTEISPAVWPTVSVAQRLHVLRKARALLANRATDFAVAISPDLARSQADTLVTELLPLLDACKFLERNAARLLAPRRLGRAGRPFWLGGVAAEVHREPLGQVLVIAPANFPLFLPGVQVLQALAAGNTVVWKPGSGGQRVAQLFAETLRQAGLAAGILTVTDETVTAAQAALAARPDKVVFTGGSEGGAAVLGTLAKSATPAVMELSGADAVVVAPSADLARAAKAIAFGLRLNGGAVCMSPRRIFATPATLAALKPLLEAELAAVPAVRLNEATAARLAAMIAEAVACGATALGSVQAQAQRPLLIENALPAMAIARSDIFAPVVSMIATDSMLHLPGMYAQCPYGLTVSIFSADERAARALARTLRAGTVLINDIIAPTADPRVPFGGRGASGFGVTRGAEGLLEMTAVKTLIVRRNGSTRHMEPVTNADAPMFAALIAAVHGGGAARRLRGLRELVKTAKARRHQRETV